MLFVACRQVGSTPLHRASQYGHVEAARLLLAAHAPGLNAKDAAGWTPLMRAAEAGRAAACQLLVEKGADLAPRTSAGKTAEDLAVLGSHGEGASRCCA